MSTKIGDNVIGTNSTTVTTGDVINPSLTATQDGADPLAYTVTAATKGTNIGSGWTYKWSGGDGVTFTTATGTIASVGDSVSTGVDFALTAHKYTVVFTATSSQGVVRTNSVDVTTGAATAPKLSSSAGSSYLNFNVKADLTDTGITDAWSYGWTSTPSATFADSTKATTSVDLPSYGTSYDLTFTATPPKGSSDKAQTATETITTKMLPAVITVTPPTSGLLYTFSADTQNKGLPSSGTTYDWSVGDTQIAKNTSASSINYLFDKAGDYQVSLTTYVNGKQIGKVQTTDVKVTADAIKPTLSAKQAGADPLAYTVTAATKGTNIGSGWTYKWSGGDGVTFTTATGTIASAGDSVSTGVDFALTAHKYTVVFTSTSPQGVVRTNSVDVTTVAATAPKLSSSAGSSDLNFNVKADLTDTGITDAWSYQWSSTPEATFKDATATSTDVEFVSGGVAYTISFTATPPEGSSDKAQTATETITTKMLPAGIIVTPPTSGYCIPSQQIPKIKAYHQVEQLMIGV